MSRAWRIEFDGALYHLMSRGNQRAEIFLNDEDRLMMVDTLGEFAERFDIEIFAYVLMSNHYHLLVRTNRANLKKAMHWLGTTYTQRFNFSHLRSGHLFQGRYKSIIVENEDYLLQLSYYVHRNPLRAKMVRRLADYRWSSYRYYAYGKTPPAWLSTDLILSRHQADENPYKSYRFKVQQYAKEEKQLWGDFRYGLLLGSKRFVDRIRRKYLPDKPRADLPQQVQLSKSVDVTSYLAQGSKLLELDLEKSKAGRRLNGADKDKRNLLIYCLWRSGKMTNRAIGEYFSISYSAVSHAVESIKSKLTADDELCGKLELLTSQFKL